MDNKVLITIPSRSRADLLSKVLKKVPFFRHFEMLIGVIESQVNEYRDTLPSHQNIKYLVFNDKIDIAHKKQGLLTAAHDTNYSHILMLDDDVRLAKRRTDDKTKFTLLDEDDVMDFIEDLVFVCTSKTPIVHPLMRLGANEVFYKYMKNKPAIRAIMLHVPTIFEYKIDYTGLKTIFMQDRYMQLSLLELGYRSVALGSYVVCDYGTNKKGGCSDYRTVELQSEAAIKLADRFSNVEVKEKTNGTWKLKRLDCHIKWKNFLDIDEPRYFKSSDLVINK